MPCPFLYKIKMYQRQLTKPSSLSIIRYHMLFPFLFGCVIYLEVNLYYYQIQSISRYQMSSITEPVGFLSAVFICYFPFIWLCYLSRSQPILLPDPIYLKISDEFYIRACRFSLSSFHLLFSFYFVV